MLFSRNCSRFLCSKVKIKLLPFSVFVKGVQVRKANLWDF